ncbi:MAG TPA: glucose 1-dehydrogenase [Ilumatobacteraceae bacterium]|nr:glucose 1-dehydrogenase [Ilumatobacteraceae bacterium]
MGKRLQGKVAVVTGGASGIGEETVREFVRQGAKVVVADIQADLARSVAESIGPDALAISCDVTDEDAVAAAIALAVDTWGRLDVMFNNAGIVGAVGPITDTDGAAWRKSIDVLLNSVFYGCKHAARVMIPQRSGSIISTTSIAGVIGGLGPHGYTAAKTAVVGLTKSVASELAQYSIRTNAIAPGTIPTPLTALSLSGSADAIDTVTEHSRLRGGMGFATAPSDIALAALYLASEDSRFVNGHTLVVDGGRSINGGSARFASSNAAMVDVAVQS